MNPMVSMSQDPFLVGPSAQLLRTIAEGLDIRRVFPRVSEIVKPVLPHDALDLVFHDRGGDVTLEAHSTDDLTGRRMFTGTDDQAFSIVNDLRWPRSRRASGASPEAVDHLLAAGYRSVLNVRSVARSQVMRLGFFSKHPNAYGPDDVPTAHTSRTTWPSPSRTNSSRPRNATGRKRAAGPNGSTRGCGRSRTRASRFRLTAG
jgi:hypothetical protein